MASQKVTDKLKLLPKTPGVYFHKNAAGETIYIGKAAILNNRVRQYFQKSRYRDPKTDALVAEIDDIEWVEVESEADALFLEAELVRRYLPPYNILLRDDKSNSYIRIDLKSDHPTVTLTRRPLDDGAEYFGPYLSVQPVRRALRYLRRAFPYSTHIGVVPKRACLQYHLGLCPGIEESKTALTEYRQNLRKLIKYFHGERQALNLQIEKEMMRSAKQKDFEAAAALRNQLYALKGLSKQILFSDKEYIDLSKDEALYGLQTLLKLDTQPARIEGYDISHMQGTDTVASMVVFSNGIPDKAQYRKFKMRIPGNDDFAHMNEVILRRFGEKHANQWPMPSLLLIDGGKGQLGAALDARDSRSKQVPAVGLAKREEQIVIDRERSGVVLDMGVLNALGGYMTESEGFIVVNLPHSTHIVKLLQRIRDESHRFAVSYHSVLKTKRQTTSLLDEIPGIGPKTRQKLLRTFGSVKGIGAASHAELVAILGEKKTEVVRRYVPFTPLVEQTEPPAPKTS